MNVSDGLCISDVEDISAPAIVTCIEAGPLEEQVLRMVESLRRWGGRLADAPVVAIRPRRGPAIASHTLKRLADFGTEFLDVRHSSKFGWYKFLNKPIAVKAAADRLNTDSICWLDADILIVQEPKELLLASDEDFAANCTDTGGLASTGPDCEHDPYWQRLCSVLGVEIDTLPWVIPHRGPGDPIRFYFNGGVFVFRRSTDFATRYLDGVERTLAASFKHPTHRCYFHEQAALGVVAIACGLRWRELSPKSNFALKLMLGSHPEMTASAAVLHYHGAMSPDGFPRFVDALRTAHPQVAEWLDRLGPIDGPVGTRISTRTAVDHWRKLRQELYLRRCATVTESGADR